MIERLWFSPRCIHKLLWPLLWPLSRLYGYVALKRKQAYEQGKKESYRSPLPVIVVGNITAGGNGKTPVVIWLVEWLQSQGYKPGVVSRGYGAKAPYYPYQVQSDSSPLHVGDEPLLIQQRTGASVVVDPKRATAVQKLESLGADIVVTDDGLQHYALQRDIEIIVIDGQRRFGNEQFIPLGPLREKLSRLESVDILINNGGQPYGKELPMQLTAKEFVNVQTGQRVAVEQFNQQVMQSSSAIAIAGIGHPPRFFRTLYDLGVNIEKEVGFADHQDYDAEALLALTPSNQLLLMTEKDAVKCRQFSQPHWWYLPVSAEMDSQVMMTLTATLNRYKEEYGSPTT